MTRKLISSLHSQLKSSSSRNMTPQGIPKTTGYQLFAHIVRTRLKVTHPDLADTAMGRTTLDMWGELSKEERDDWCVRATAVNKGNGYL